MTALLVVVVVLAVPVLALLLGRKLRARRIEVSRPDPLPSPSVRAGAEPRGEPVTPVWVAELPAGQSSNGHFVVTAAGHVVLKAGRERLRAYDGAGKQAWVRRFEDDFYFRVFQERLYVGGESARCVLPASGEIVAEKVLGPGCEAIGGCGGAAAFYVEEASPQSPDEIVHRLVGLDPSTLDLLWEYPHPSQAQVHDDGICDYSPADGVVTLLRVPSFDVICRLPVRNDNDWIPFHVHSGDLFVAKVGGERLAFDVKTGQQVWSHSGQKDRSSVLSDRASNRWNLLAVGELLLEWGEGLKSVDPRSGAPRWQCDAVVPNEPLVMGSRVIATAASGKLLVLEADSGRRVATLELPYTPWRILRLDDTRVVAILMNQDTSQEEILCLDLTAHL